MNDKPLAIELYSGSKHMTQALREEGFNVVSIDNNPDFEPDVVEDVFNLTPEIIRERWGQPAFVWASPPCTTFSVASLGAHWNRDGTPKTEECKTMIRLAEHTLRLLEALGCPWVMENPRGKMRKLPFMQDRTRHTVTYCQYGDSRQKPTDLWTNTNITFKPACPPRAACHEPAPRGCRTGGTQALSGAHARGKIPKELCRYVSWWVRYHRNI